MGVPFIPQLHLALITVHTLATNDVICAMSGAISAKFWLYFSTVELEQMRKCHSTFLLARVCLHFISNTIK